MTNIQYQGFFQPQPRLLRYRARVSSWQGRTRGPSWGLPRAMSSIMFIDDSKRPLWTQHFDIFSIGFAFRCWCSCQCGRALLSDGGVLLLPRQAGPALRQVLRALVSALQGETNQVQGPILTKTSWWLSVCFNRAWSLGILKTMFRYRTTNNLVIASL